MSFTHGLTRKVRTTDEHGIRRMVWVQFAAVLRARTESVWIRVFPSLSIPCESGFFRGPIPCKSVFFRGSIPCESVFFRGSIPCFSVALFRVNPCFSVALFRESVFFRGSIPCESAA